MVFVRVHVVKNHLSAEQKKEVGRQAHRRDRRCRQARQLRTPPASLIGAVLRAGPRELVRTGHDRGPERLLAGRRDRATGEPVRSGGARLVVEKATAAVRSITGDGELPAHGPWVHVHAVPQGGGAAMAPSPASRRHEPPSPPKSPKKQPNPTTSGSPEKASAALIARPARSGSPDVSPGQTIPRRIRSTSLRKSGRFRDTIVWTLQYGIFPENIASLALHKQAGFRVVGRREPIGEHHDRWRDVLLIERRSTRVGHSTSDCPTAPAAHPTC